ncbi:MAG: FKBP-type peptidyl-prolyl cis-trans isomerase [Nitrospirota bacterium]
MFRYALFALMLLGAPISAAAADEPAGKKHDVSYSIGMDIGATLKRQSLELDPDAVAAGLKDALTGAKTKLTAEQAREILTTFQEELRAKAEERAAQLAEKNKKEGEAFLAENKKKAGVKTLPSGLQYKVLTEGKGKLPKATDTVTAHYRGTLIDGTEFDSSYQRGEPATFPVTGLIAGWTEALQLMKVGSKWQLFIPSDLAYGPRTASQLIGPNATLIFEVELLSVQEGDAGAAAPGTEN